MGVSIFAGEAEGRLDKVLRDAAEGCLAAEYNFLKDLPGCRERQCRSCRSGTSSARSA